MRAPVRVEIWARKVTSAGAKLPVGHSGVYGQDVITHDDLMPLRAGYLTDRVIGGCITLLVSENQHAVLLTAGSTVDRPCTSKIILLLYRPSDDSTHRILFVFSMTTKMWLSYDTENGDHRESVSTQHTRLFGGTVPFQYEIVQCPGQDCGFYSGDFVVAFALAVVREQQLPQLATSDSRSFGSAMRSFIAKTIYCNNLALTVPEPGECPQLTNRFPLLIAEIENPSKAAPSPATAGKPATTKPARKSPVVS